MAYDEALAARVRLLFAGRRDIAERKMFGGLAFLLDGRMCCGIVGTDLMVRVTEAEAPAAQQQLHVRPMDFTGRPLRGFIYVAAEGCATAAALEKWVAHGVRFAERVEAPEKAEARPSPAGRARSS